MPFNRFRTPDGKQVDTLLGPEMRSTGEVMGFDADFGTAFAKAQTAAFGSLPVSGSVFVSMANRDKRSMVFPIKVLADLGFEILATQGTAEVLRRNGVRVEVVRKHFEGAGPEGEPTSVQLIACRQGGPRREHPARRLRWRVGPDRRLRDPHRRGDGERPLHHDRPRAGGGRPGHRGAAGRRHRGAVAAGLGASPVTPYRLLFDRVLTRVDPEVAHRLGFTALRAARPVLDRMPPAGRRARPAGLPVRALGLDFPGPLGLAAGFDKNAEGIDALAALGFSFVEVGTVTGEPQPGNPRPRLFRLPADRAVVNRMGFNNDGAEAVARRLAARRAGRHGDVVVGVNIGQTKAVPRRPARWPTTRRAPACSRRTPTTWSSTSAPRTPRGCATCRQSTCWPPCCRRYGGRRRRSARTTCPLLVKIAPDLADKDVLAVADLALDLHLDGIVATNTTTTRDGLRSTPAEVALAGPGGLSGPPVRARATEVLRLLRERVGPDLTLVAVGGIENAQDARERLDAGATLLQAYTAFVYEGARWPSRLQRELRGDR